jgi:hypothetical protein
MRPLLLVLAMAAGTAGALPVGAQAPSPCDKLAGEEQKRCLKIEEERSREWDRLGRDEDTPRRSCDELFGPDKERCLKRGGTVRAGTHPSGAAGASAAPRIR